MSQGPRTPFSESLHAQKYRGPGESFREYANRVAGVLAPGEDFHAFRDVLLEQRFLPGGRIQQAVGSTRETTPYNCLDAGTRFITREHGVIDLATAFEYGEVTLLDGNGEWQRAKINEFGIREMYGVRLTSGRISKTVFATAYHRWILDDGQETTTAELRRGSTVSYVHAPDIDRCMDLDYQDGLVHGIVYGDGSFQASGRYQIRLCGSKRVLEAFLPALSVTHPESAGGDPFVTLESDVNLKVLPLGKSPAYLRGFMVGWMATDGCVSEQPEVSICMGPDEVRWCQRWAPVAGWHPLGWSRLADRTNFGERGKESGNLRFDRASLSVEDFLMPHHSERFRPRAAKWRVAEIHWKVRRGMTYCPRVLSTSSFVLEGGIHTGQCYVSGTIEDSLTRGEGSIMARLSQAAATMQMGGGIGYDFSTLRPRGAAIKKLGSRSSGPISFMGIYNALCLTIASAGHRRGAQMGVMRIDHPDIEEFIRAKQDAVSLTGFNVSIAVTDEFMKAVRDGRPFDLRWGGEVYRTIDARALWDMVMRSTWDWAEPGVLFIDRINELNPLYYCETIAATNPCGEQPLPPFGACLLGSFNLVKYLRLYDHGGIDGLIFDHEAFRRDISIVVGAMDRVIDIARYPLYEQEKEAKSKRRMGLGVTGLANTIEATGYAYGSPEFIICQKEILRTLRDEAYRTSALLADSRGSFPLFNVDRYLAGPFARKLPEDVRELIRHHGLRNSHLLSIAPTGTISLTADNVSSGIEPVFSFAADRTIQEFDGPVTYHVEDYGAKFLATRGKTADQITAEEHVAVLCAAQEFVDSAVSKTCNVSPDMPWEDFKALYMRAWEGGAKGCTTFNAGGKRMGVLQAKSDEPEATACRITEDGKRECE